MLGALLFLCTLLNLHAHNDSSASSASNISLARQVFLLINENAGCDGNSLEYHILSY